MLSATYFVPTPDSTHGVPTKALITDDTGAFFITVDTGQTILTE